MFESCCSFQIYLSALHRLYLVFVSCFAALNIFLGDGGAASIDGPSADELVFSLSDLSPAQFSFHLDAGQQPHIEVWRFNFQIQGTPSQHDDRGLFRYLHAKRSLALGLKQRRNFMSTWMFPLNMKYFILLVVSLKYNFTVLTKLTL